MEKKLFTVLVVLLSVFIVLEVANIILTVIKFF